MNAAPLPAVAVVLTQGTQEWLDARAGSLGASQIADMMAKTRSGYGASRANLAARMICERLTGVPAPSFDNEAMRWGRETEPQARGAYEAETGNVVETTGLHAHPTLAYTHASPDGLVRTDGLIEIKCPQTATHIEVLLSETVPSKYILQMQWQMRCTDRQWCDFFSYDPRMPESMRAFCKRITRDNGMIAEIEAEATTFLREVSERVLALQTKYPQAA